MLTAEGGRIETTGGYVYWNFYSDDGDYIEIYGLYVAPKYRNKGYAMALFQGAISVIEAQYLGEEIRIIPNPKEEGIEAGRLSKFYSSLGFEVMGRENQNKGVKMKKVPLKCKKCAHWGKWGGADGIRRYNGCFGRAVPNSDACKRNVTSKESK